MTETVPIHQGKNLTGKKERPWQDFWSWWVGEAALGLCPDASRHGSGFVDEEIRGPGTREPGPGGALI